jgi:hypothetical protein
MHLSAELTLTPSSSVLSRKVILLQFEPGSFDPGFFMPIVL